MTADRLTSAWLRATVEDGWFDVDEWHQTVVDDVVAAALTGADLRPAVSALAGQRCIFGVTLDETLADLGAFLRVVPDELVGVADRFTLGRSAADAWYRASVDPQVVQPCRDALTGLATETHLMVRAAEIHDMAAATGDNPSQIYELVVLGWDQQERSAAQLAVRIRLAALFQRSFTGGPTIALVGDAAIVVLTRRDLCPPEAIDTLTAGLDEALAGSACTKPTRWPFPRSVDALTDLLVSLHGSADRDTWTHWRSLG